MKQQRFATGPRSQYKIDLPEDIADVVFSEQEPDESRAEYIIRMFETAFPEHRGKAPKLRPRGSQVNVR